MQRLAGYVLALATLASPVEAATVELLTDGLNPGTLPYCQDGAVTGDVQEQFAYGAVNVSGSPTVIAALTDIHQTHPTQIRPSPVARRYCAATAVLSTGKKTPVYFLIEQRLGFAGYTWNVESCASGWDRWHVHDGRCRTVRKWW